VIDGAIELLATHQPSDRDQHSEEATRHCPSSVLYQPGSAHRDAPVPRCMRSLADTRPACWVLVYSIPTRSWLSWGERRCAADQLILVLNFGRAARAMVAG
jgi:hypothetical protein